MINAGCTFAYKKRTKDATRLGFKDVATSKDFKYLNQVVKNYLK